MITLYTIHCPACKVLAKKLDAKNIPYAVIDDIDALRDLGITQFPILEVDGTRMTLGEANKYIESRK